MAETEDVGGQIQGGLFPSGTSIIDFAYEESNSMRKGYYNTNYSDYEGEVYSDEEFEERLSESGTGYFVENDSEYYVEPNSNSDIINRKAIALFDFVPESDNEVGLTEGQIIWVSYRHGQGWLVSEDFESGKNGLVPEEYVKIINNDENYDYDYDDDDDDSNNSNKNYGNDDNDDGNYDESKTKYGDKRRLVYDDVPKPFLPLILHSFNAGEVSQENESEWVDTDEEENNSPDKTYEQDDNGFHSLKEIQHQFKEVSLSQRSHADS